MAKKPKIPEKYQAWIDARKRYHLSHAHIQMARELGMNPNKFGKIYLINNLKSFAPIDFPASTYGLSFNDKTSLRTTFANVGHIIIPMIIVIAYGIILYSR